MVGVAQPQPLRGGEVLSLLAEQVRRAAELRTCGRAGVGGALRRLGWQRLDWGGGSLNAGRCAARAARHLGRQQFRRLLRDVLDRALDCVFDCFDWLAGIHGAPYPAAGSGNTTCCCEAAFCREGVTTRRG